MLTKMAFDLLAHGKNIAIKGAIPAAFGGFMATNNEKQRKALIEEYDLPSNANLGLRNAGRTAAGYLGGSLVGQYAGSTLSHMTGAGPLYLPALGKLIGGVAGLNYGMEKYGPAAAKEIMRRKAKEESAASKKS